MPPKVHTFVKNTNNSYFSALQNSIENNVSPRMTTPVTTAYFFIRMSSGFWSISNCFNGLY